MVSTVMVKIFSAPGKTTPTAGATVSHFAPAVAVNEIGAPLVVSVTVCAEVVEGATVSVMMEELSASVGKGGATTSVTGIETTGSPLTVMVTVEV